MATIIESLNYYKQNPNDPRGVELKRRLKAGELDTKLKTEGVVRVGNELKARQQEQTGFEKFAKGVEEYAPGGKLAKGVASAVTIPMATKSLDDITASVNTQNQTLIEKMREARTKGEDVTKYKEALKANQKLLQSSIDALDTEIEQAPTTGQVVGGAAELATMAVPGSVGGSLARKVGAGVATGYAGDVATNLASGRTGTEAITPGLGTAIGAGVPVIGAGAKAGAKVLKDVAPDIANKVSKLVKLPVSVAKATGEVASDIVGTKQGAVNSLVARSLKLAPVEDINRISSLVGEDIGTKMASHNLIKNTPAQTEEALKKFARDNYNLKNDLIALVDENFPKQEVPEIQDLTQMLSDELTKTKSPQYKQALERIKAIQNADAVSLEDVNYVRAVFDDIESVYNRAGSVRDDLMASDKANLANKLREFVDSRVAEVYPDANIREISKNIMFGKAMEDAIIKRSGKFDTQSPLALSDLFVLGIPNDPVTGAALLATKKIAGSSPIKLRVAQAIAKTMGNTGVEAKRLKELSAMVTEELKKSFDFTEKTPNLTKKVIEKTNTTPTVPKEKITNISDTLLQEAKNYKSAEEFVKAHGKEIYHATDSEPFDVFDIGKAKKGEAYFNPLGTGQYLSSNKEFVKRFGSNTMEYILPKSAKTKIITLNSWANKDYPVIIKQSLKKLGIDYNDLDLDEKVLLNRQVPDSPIMSLNNAAVIIGDIAERFGKDGDIQKIIEQVSDSRNSNYDAIIFRNTDSAFEADEILIPKASVIKTKQQLIDTYNKAHGVKGSPTK